MGYDLAYRGVVPRSLARFLGGGTAAIVRQLILTTAQAMGVLRARYMRGVKAWAKEQQRQQQAEQEPEQQQQEDLNVAGEAPLLALEDEAAAAAEAGLCTGPRCEAGLARGMEPGLIARNGLCWRCQNSLLAGSARRQGLLWNPQKGRRSRNAPGGPGGYQPFRGTCTTAGSRAPTQHGNSDAASWAHLSRPGRPGVRPPAGGCMEQAVQMRYDGATPGSRLVLFQVQRSLGR